MKYLLVGFFGFILLIVGISVYLSPNDLVDCSRSNSCSKADYVVVVSGGDTSARTDHGIKIYQSGWANKIVLSGAAQDKTGPSNAAAMRLQALAAGIPDEDIIIEENSESTKQNAEEVRDLINAGYGSKKIILVTSGYHQRRMYLEFSKQLYSSQVEILNSPVLKDKQWSVVWWATPQGWWLAGSELTKILGFYMGESR